MSNRWGTPRLIAMNRATDLDEFKTAVKRCDLFYGRQLDQGKLVCGSLR